MSNQKNILEISKEILALTETPKIPERQTLTALTMIVKELRRLNSTLNGASNTKTGFNKYPDGAK